MNFEQALRILLQDLEKVYSHREAVNIVKIIGEDIFGVYNLQSNRELSLADVEKFDLVRTQVSQGIPVQYMTARADFMGLRLFVDHRVLIPRPETEELANWILSDLKTVDHANILDIGTGSGCIALALKHFNKTAEVDALDVSKEALKVAEVNFNKYHAKINPVHKDILLCSEHDFDRRYDVVVSNPPYIGTDEIKEVDEHVHLHEPLIALYSSDDALQFYKTISRLSIDLLREEGSLYFELNPKYSEEIVALCLKCGFKHVQVKKDMQGKVRMLKATKG